MPMPVVVLSSLPLLFAIVPPEPAVPEPVTVRPPLMPVLLRIMPVLDPPLEEMLRKLKPLTPMIELTTLSAVPVVVEIVLPAPLTLIAVAPPVALNPVPLVVLMARPPPLKLIEAPVFPESVTAALADVLRLFDAPLKVTVPPELVCTRMPVPVLVRLPDRITWFAVRP